MTTNENNYTCKITETSREFTAREKIIIKDTSNANKIDELVNGSEGGKYRLTVADYAVLAVHNDNADNPDYNIYVLLDETGNKYITSSNAFWRAFEEFADEIFGSGEKCSIEIFKKESKKYKGKFFLTCSLV